VLFKTMLRQTLSNCPSTEWGKTLSGWNSDGLSVAEATIIIVRTTMHEP
jgi:hypothetical protein